MIGPGGSAEPSLRLLLPMEDSFRGRKPLAVRVLARFEAFRAWWLGWRYDGFNGNLSHVLDFRLQDVSRTRYGQNDSRVFATVLQMHVVLMQLGR